MAQKRPVKTGTATMQLRFAGPLQSWGGAGGILRRTTLREPTKSGVLGLLAAAEGRERGAPIDDLAALSMGVRVDAAGVLLRDFHLASDYRGFGLPTAAVSKAGEQRRRNPRRSGTSQVTQRFYLQDAVFLVAVRGTRALIDSLADAVRAPAFPLALGRRSCPPSLPLLCGVSDLGVPEVLAVTPWLASPGAKARFSEQRGRPSQVDLPVALDDPDGGEVLHDVPTSFDYGRRAFVPRRVRRDWVSVPTGFADPDPQASGHDPFALLGW